MYVLAQYPGRFRGSAPMGVSGFLSFHALAQYNWWLPAWTTRIAKGPSLPSRSTLVSVDQDKSRRAYCSARPEHDLHVWGSLSGWGFWLLVVLLALHHQVHRFPVSGYMVVV